MRRPDLNILAQFVVVARHLNFRRAAKELAISPSTLSDRIRELEDQMGGRLFNRTTRSASLTDLGVTLLAQTADALAVLEDAANGIATGATQGQLVGKIRINGPRPALELCLMPLVVSFLAKNPGVRVEVVTQDELVDVVAGGFDAGVRYTEMLAQDMIAIGLGAEQRMVIAASPDYLKQNGTPRHPRDLLGHNCIGTVFATGNVLPWSLERQGEDVEFTPQSNLIVNSIENSLIGARASVGLVYTFEDYVVEDLATGRLVEVMPEWTPPFPGPSLYFSERRLMPPALRAFVDHVKEPTGLHTTKPKPSR
ncbi:LysR family transcriptional regulator [Pelagibacterium montanilacus]|uniref:LysR family transcriptional regulator n=1 Tax=Pelagibacterium montanilacus TaxID=2185280 RepID=UPI000F8EAF02|nr:LysR family transcriptional regulator [Pelagibacterium montanilacus]